MANVLVYFHDNGEGVLRSSPSGEGVDLTLARDWEDLSGRLHQGHAFDLIILEGTPPGERTEMVKRIKKIKDVPVLVFEDKKTASPAGAGAVSPPEKWKETGALLRSREPLEIARQYMDDNFRSALTLEEIAKRAGISASYFCRKFKSSYGESPITYLRNLRIARASHLLEHTALPLSEISAQSGFFSVSYFCREFKKTKGHSPMQYRREKMRKQD
jgi:AraC-like DNA-binding protein